MAGPEYGNATKTYTNATAACIVLASHILRRAWQENAGHVVESYSNSLDLVFQQRNKMEEFCRGAANIEVIGRGPAHGAAIMGALCIREMTGQRAAPHSGSPLPRPTPPPSRGSRIGPRQMRRSRPRLPGWGRSTTSRRTHPTTSAKGTGKPSAGAGGNYCS